MKIKLASSVASLISLATFLGPVHDVSARIASGITGDAGIEETHENGMEAAGEAESSIATAITTGADALDYRGRHLQDNDQLVLWWIMGMKWQGRRGYRAWCAQPKCRHGTSVRLKECDKDSERQRLTVVDGTLRPTRCQNLCIDHRGRRRGFVQLRRCNGRDTQQWENLNEEGEIQIHPKNKPRACLTQSHHPKKNEKLKVTSCRRAERNDRGVKDDTSRWVFGRFGGHDTDPPHEDMDDNRVNTYVANLFRTNLKFDLKYKSDTE